MLDELSMKILRALNLNAAWLVCVGVNPRPLGVRTLCCFPVCQPGGLLGNRKDIADHGTRYIHGKNEATCSSGKSLVKHSHKWLKHSLVKNKVRVWAEKSHRHSCNYAQITDVLSP